MQTITEKDKLDFPLIVSLEGLPIINGKKLDAVWRAKNLPEFYTKLKTYTDLDIELMLPEELLANNKYGLPLEDISEFQQEENLALIHLKK